MSFYSTSPRLRVYLQNQIVGWTDLRPFAISFSPWPLVKIKFSSACGMAKQ